MNNDKIRDMEKAFYEHMQKIALTESDSLALKFKAMDIMHDFYQKHGS